MTTRDPAHDPILEALFDLKESTGRIEQKIDRSTKDTEDHEERLKKIEDNISMAKGVYLLLAMAWAFLIAWIAGLGQWVHQHIAYLLANNNTRV